LRISDFLYFISCTAKFTAAVIENAAASTFRGDVFRIRAMPSPIAIIIPALNEEAALAPLLDGLRAALDAAACLWQPAGRAEI
jgi:hypothetical protein